MLKEPDGVNSQINYFGLLELVSVCILHAFLNGPLVNATQFQFKKFVEPTFNKAAV